MENSKEKLTMEELRDWLAVWKDSYDGTLDEEAKVEYGEECEQAYNQLVEIVEEHFHLKQMSLEEAQRWVEREEREMATGLKQQNAKPKVRRADIHGLFLHLKVRVPEALWESEIEKWLKNKGVEVEE